MYENILSYAKCELIPRFQMEFSEYKKISNCPSYEEMKDLCSVLNLVAKYTAYNKQTPIDFIG